MSEPHVVVVGASLAGIRTVESLRAGGFTGRITVLGAESHRPYDRPPLSKQFLAGAWDGERIALRREDDYREALACDLRLGVRADGLDLAARVLRTSTGDVGFDGLVIATGARPRHLPGTDGLPNVHVLRTIDDSQRLRAALVPGARLVVVGAGFIGAEVAATAHGRGCDVTVVEALPVPYERQLGTQMAEVCAALHARHGVPLRTGLGVEAIEPGGVRVAGGEVLSADAVVVGIGVVPNVEWLEGSGVLLGDGVRCDDRCRVLTADGVPVPAVVAAGDLARWPNPLFPGLTDPAEPESMRVEHWTNAAEMGDHAARTLLADLAGADDPGPFAPVPYFWSDQYDVKIQFLGRATAHDEVRIVDGPDEQGRLLALYRRGDRLVGALGISKMRLLIGYRKLLAERASWADALAHAGL